MKQLPQKFAAHIYPATVLTPYIVRAALNGELELPEEWHVENIQVETIPSILDPEIKMCRISGDVVPCTYRCNCIYQRGLTDRKIAA